MSRTQWLWIGGAVVVLLLGVLVWRHRNSQNQKVQYQTATVQKGTLVQSVTASGQVMTVNSVDVTTSATGVVKTVYVKDGDVVHAGDKIMDLNLDQSSQQAQAKAWASYIAAKNELDSANQGQADNRKSVQSASNAVTSAEQAKISDQKDVDTAQANVYAAQADYNAVADRDPSDLTRQQKASALQAAQDALTLAQQKLATADNAITEAKLGVTAANAHLTTGASSITKAKADVDSAYAAWQATSATVVSPMDGTIGDITLASGMVIGGNKAASSSSSSSAAAASSSSAQKVATIRNGGSPVAAFNVSEIDVPKVQSGQKATVTLDAISSKTFTGKVIGIDQTGVVSSGVTNYPVTVQFDTASSDVLPNMSASVAIITATKDNVLLVPNSAVQTANGQSTVQVMVNGQPQTTTVEIGDQSDTQTEITSGLKEGDTVVTRVITPTTSRTATGGSSVFSGGLRLGGFGGGGVRTGGGGGAARGD